MEKAKLMQEEIENKRKLPKDVKEKINAHILRSLIAAIVIMAYFCGVNVAYKKLSGLLFEQAMKYIGLLMVLITIITFEFAYRKPEWKLTFIGIELLACSILSIYIPYIYLHTSSSVKIVVLLLPVILVLYYLIKSLLIFKKQQYDYQNNLSDVKELLKNNEKESYLEEKSKKSYREKIKQEEKIKDEIAKEQVIRKHKKEQLKKSKEQQANKKTTSANQTKGNKNNLEKSNNSKVNKSVKSEKVQVKENKPIQRNQNKKK